LGRMGFSPREIENAISDVLNLARATGTELAEAADFAANSMRIFGIESTKMAHVADVLTVTANSSAQTLTDLFEALKIAGPQANAAGEGIEATSAALGVLANMGIKGSLAGTALRKSYSQFAKMDVQNTLSQWGVSTVDATGNLRKLSEVMVEIAKVMQRMPTAERLTFAEEIFDLRGSLAGLSITANTKALDDFILKLEHVGGVASTTAQKMDQGLGGSFRLLASAAEGSMNAIGDTLSRTLQPMIANMITGLNAFTGWINANGKLVTQIAGGIAVVGALGVALLTLGTAAKICGAGVGVLRVATTGVINAWGLMKSAAMGVGNAIALISNAFANYNNTAQPALVSTSRFLAALRLPIDRRANQIAASLVLMSNAETAATVKGALVAKWKALTAVLTQANAATIASTVVTKAHTLAQMTAAAATKALTIARTIATAITSKLTLSTLASSAAGAAASAVNTTLAVSTKVAAAGYLALNGAMRAFCALPIAAVTMAIVGAIGVFYSKARKAAQYTAQLSDSMSKLREEGDKSRKTDALRMQRLVQLSESQKLSNEEIAEAEKLTATLTERYGDFGASIDAVAGRLNLATDAQDRFNEAMKRVRLQQIRAEIAELQANISELDSEYESTRHWSNYNYLSKLTGNFDETLNRQGDIMEKRWAYEAQIRALMFLMDDIEKGVDEVEEEVEATLATSIAEAEQKKLATQEEILAAEKRIAEIETELRRERQSALENEIEDIKALTDEYVNLQNVLIAQAQAKGDNTAVDALEAKIQKA
ncbi:MAG: phage tail tape measure protein, partial [bacterium]|nr:phage tail tape measure protein [bacterium]